jgi:hypothetical protein
MSQKERRFGYTPFSPSEPLKKPSKEEYKVYSVPAAPLNENPLRMIHSDEYYCPFTENNSYISIDKCIETLKDYENRCSKELFEIKESSKEDMNDWLVTFGKKQAAMFLLLKLQIFKDNTGKSC